MHELLFHHQTSLEEEDLRRYAGQLALDSSAFENDRTGASVSDRIRRDVQGGLATGQIQGTPPCSSTESSTAAAMRSTLSELLAIERDLLTPRQHRADGAAATHRWVRGLPRDRRVVGASAYVSVLRPGRVLRQLAASARFGSCRSRGTPDRAFRRTRGGLELVLPGQR
jgi:hypothetical protein